MKLRNKSKTHKNGFLNKSKLRSFPQSIGDSLPILMMTGYKKFLEVLIMESISVKKSEVIRFRVAELMHKVARFVKSFNYRMEVIK